MIKDSGNRREFGTGAVRDIHQGKGRYDLLPWDAIHELAQHCEEGALKYGERNCEKGIPVHSFIDSAIRHLSCYLRGMTDEPHLRAALWNVAFAIWTEKNHPEMQDIPIRTNDESIFDELEEDCYDCRYRDASAFTDPCEGCANCSGNKNHFERIDNNEDN